MDSIKEYKLYELKYKPEFCQMLRDHMAEGKSYSAFAAKIKTSRSVLYNWEKTYPEWAQAKAEAFDLCRDFFEEKLLTKISGKSSDRTAAKNIDTTCLIFALKTRLHETYGDRHKIEAEVNGNTEIKLAYNLDD